LALYYNKDLFDRYGEDYPDGSWSHNEYLAAMKRLTRDVDGDGRVDVWGSMIDIGWDRVQVHINGWGGHIVDPTNPRRSMLVEPESLAALRWIRARMWDDRCMATSLDVQNLGMAQAFALGRLAMVEDGSWSLKNILEVAPFRVGVAPLPAGPVRRVTLASTDGFGIYRGTRYPEAAWELLKFLTTREYARASLVDEWISLARAQYPEQTREMDLAVFAEGHVQGYSVVAETFANMTKPGAIVNAAFQQIFTLGRAPVETMYEVTAQIEEAQGASQGEPWRSE
jgi:ABC-type glycerol-3-phosphate transport system substrate-binding protein